MTDRSPGAARDVTRRTTDDPSTITWTLDQWAGNPPIPTPASRFRSPTALAEVAVWAPLAGTVTLVTDVDGVRGEHAMSSEPGGWWRAPADLAPAPGSAVRYGFSLDGGPVRPDPRSARQPDGVHHLSALYTTDPRVWTDAAWTGREVRGAVLYELHVGTFTPSGTLDSAIERLDHLVALGVDFVELMPLNAVNGEHNWGYDGVGWFAVHEPYGGPSALVRFVDACHARGLGVVLDVVYNHLGPSGNYLPEFGPYLTNSSNSWGDSLNLSDPDSDEVRAYIIGNALRWFDEFHIDALRLDAVHALIDHRAVGILEELAIATDALAADLGRPLALIAESDLNDPRLIAPRPAGGYGLTAQWDDDIHHAVHTAVSGERQGYYADFGSLECLAKVMRGGFFHDGTYSSFRGRRHGRPVPPGLVPASALLAYTCNHDQIGNRAVGDRPTAYLDGGQLAIKAALVLLGPYTPMLFMGEEWAASTPFAFFTSHPEPELAEAVRNGRRSEFAEHGWAGADVPDPQAESTFLDSKLDWSELGAPDHTRMYAFYRDLVMLRKRHPELHAGEFDSVDVEFDSEAGWFAMHRGPWTVLAVLADSPTEVPIPLAADIAWTPTEPTDGGLRSPGHNVVVGRRR